MIFTVLSGAGSKGVSQYMCKISDRTCEHNKLPDTGYLLLKHKDKDIIVRYERDNKSYIEYNHIALHSSTHSRTLSVTTGDTVKASLFSEKIERTNIRVKLFKSDKIINYPVLSEPLYVRPGYYIACHEGMGMVLSGSGLYQFEVDNALDAMINNSDPFGQQDNSAGINVNFCQMGIGGLETQMTGLIKQVLISRIVPEEMQEIYNIEHIKGILLYGPPGTGKTLIARNIGKIIPDSVVTKINGPELCNKFYGETENNIRKIFSAADDAPDKMHIIIFDEIDAIGKKRGSGGSSGHMDDKALTQLLTAIDGLESAKNIFVIGITNRKEILDEAILRCGRLEYHLEIPLPTIKGRKEILNICLESLKKKNLVSNIDIEFWANTLDGYSGSDIKSLVSRCKNLALLRNCNIDENRITASDNISDLAVLTQDDMLTSYSSFTSTFSRNDGTVQCYVDNYPLESLSDNEALNITDLDIPEVMIKPYIVDNLAVFGSPNTNEIVRAKACHLARALQFCYIKYLSYNEFLGMDSRQNCDLLGDVYNKCLQAERAVLILDSLADVGDRALLLKQRYIMNNPLSRNKQLVIICL